MKVNLPNELKAYLEAEKEIKKAELELENKFDLKYFTPESGPRQGQRVAMIDSNGIKILDSSPFTYEEGVEFAFWLSQLFGI